MNRKRRESILTLTTCMSIFLMLLLVGMFVGRVSAQLNVDEYVQISVDCGSGTVEVMGSEYLQLPSTYNSTTPMHTPSGVDLTSMNQSDVKEVTLTFSASNSTLVVWAEDASRSRSIGDAWATMLSTGFQTSLVYDSTTMGGLWVNYMGAGKSNLGQFMQSLMSWCTVADFNGFSSALVGIAGKPGAYVTVDMTPASDNYWNLTIKATYDTTTPTGSGSHTVDVLSLLGVTSLAPSPYSAENNSANQVSYQSSVVIMITSNQTVSYASSQPPGLSTVEPPFGVLAPRGWADYGATLTGPEFDFENDSTAVNQLSLTFNGSVVPEFPSTAILPLLIAISVTAMLTTKRLQRRTKINI